MISLVGRLLLLPVAMLGHFLEACGRVTLSAEQIAGDAFERMVREGLQPLLGNAAALPPVPEAPAAARPPLEQNAAQPHTISIATLGWPALRPPHLEERDMADTNLNDDMIKLVEYAIVYVKRRAVRILDHATDAGGKHGSPLLYIEDDNVTGDGFSNARIADWVKNHPDEAKKLDLDSLRVYYSVVARWPKSDLRYEEERLDMEQRKLELLEAIKNKP